MAGNTGSKSLDTRVGKSVVTGLDSKIAKENRRLDRNNSGPGDIVKEKYDAALKGATRTLWDGILQIGASNFGKGVIIAAIAVVVVTALAFGFGASLGQIALASGGAASVEQGVALGIGIGLRVMMSGFGAMAMLAGGAVGAVVDWRARQKEISLGDAQELAKQYEQSRGQSPQLQPEVPTPTQDVPQQGIEDKFVPNPPEEAAPATQTPPPPPVPAASTTHKTMAPKGSWAATEKQRRMEPPSGSVPSPT